MQVEAEENDVTQETESEQQENAPTGETPEGEQESGGADEESGEVVVSIGDESPSSEEDELQKAPQWVKDLRKENRDKARRIRELEEAAAKRETEGKTADAVKKPTMADCDYDEEEYEKRYDAWQKQERERQAEVDRQKAEQAAQEATWKAKLTAYDDGKTALKLADFEDAEAGAREALNQTQMGIIIHGAKNPALVTYALGKAPAKLKELASIKDPIQFAFAVANLEAQVKTTTRKVTPPVAEAPVRGNTPASLGGDSELARLEAEAERTGDRTKVVAYRRQKLKAANN